MLSILLLAVGSLLAGFSLWQLRRWLLTAQSNLTDGPRRLEALAEELLNSAEAATAAVAEETERLAELIARAETRAAELRALVKESAEPVRLPAPGAGPARARPAHTAVAAVPLRFRHARKEIRRSPAERAALSQPGPALGPAPGPALGLTPGPGNGQSPASAHAGVPSPSLPMRPAAAAGEMPETHRLVYSLADKGSNVTQIARQLSITKGEVQLILGLRRLN